MLLSTNKGRKQEERKNSEAINRLKKSDENHFMKQNADPNEVADKLSDTLIRLIKEELESKIKEKEEGISRKNNAGN